MYPYLKIDYSGVPSHKSVSLDEENLFGFLLIVHCLFKWLHIAIAKAGGVVDAG